MVVNQPGIFIKPDHGHVTQDNAFVLVDKVTRYVGTLAVQSAIGAFYLVLVLFDESVFAGINKTGFKEKIPQCIQINGVADIGVFIPDLVQKPNQRHVVLRADIEQGQAATDPAAALTLL